MNDTFAFRKISLEKTASYTIRIQSGKHYSAEYE